MRDITITSALSAYLGQLGTQLADMRLGLHLRTLPGDETLHSIVAYLDDTHRIARRHHEVRDVLASYESEPDYAPLRRSALAIITAYRDDIGRALGVPGDDVGAWSVAQQAALAEAAE